MHASTAQPSAPGDALRHDWPRAPSRELAGPTVVPLRRKPRPPEGSRRELSWHQHERGQILCIETGVIHMRTESSAWLLAPHRAAWIPPGVPHTSTMIDTTTCWSLLVPPDAARSLPARPCMVGVSELMRSLMRRATTWASQQPLAPEQRRLLVVLLDELRHAPQEPTHLVLPSDRRLLRLANSLLEQPDQARTLKEWAAWAGMSPRTVNRLFNAEVGLTFANWRQHAMLMHAVVRLTRGDSVGTVADTLGYASPSNFIAMFRRCFGESPTRYLLKQAAGQPADIHPFDA